MKYLLLLLLIGCANLPPKPKYKVGDCYHYHLNDVTYGMGYGSRFDLQIYKISRQKDKSGNYRDYIFFRPIKDNKYIKDVNLNPGKYKTTGLVWMLEYEFRKSIFNPEDGRGLESTGWAMFSYGEVTRNGITCNDVYEDR